MSETTERPPFDREGAALPADFRAVFHASPSPMLVIAADPPRYTMVAVNPTHAAAFRTTVEALIGNGLFEVFPEAPDPTTAAFIDTVRASLERVLRSRHADEMPVQAYAVLGPDGQPEERYWGATQTPVFGPGGTLTHIISTVRDVTSEVKERQATEARALLMREVDHRARNALTVVQSIVRLTEASDVEAFKQVVLGRVDALSRAQTSLARRKWEGAYLKDVVEAELTALAAVGAWRLEGPPVLLPPEKVQAMSMAIHELATNAAKYGALSTPGGEVAVAWQREDPAQLRLTWRESGGPPVKPPRRTGFGSRLIRQLSRQLHGNIRKDWRADGLVAELTAAL